MESKKPEALVCTRQEAAAILRQSVTTIDELEASGVLKRCDKLRGVRFPLVDVVALTGTRPSDFSPQERRRLLRENERLQRQVEQYRELFGMLVAQVGAIMTEGAKNEETRPWAV
ncbi:MAG: helix-turn-helix domain-containing protein [Veillonellaceae bacterium]|nr:helix-turn-helix domain-containing protein [Veillonellaceae bacterium]